MQHFNLQLTHLKFSERLVNEKNTIHKFRVKVESVCRRTNKFQGKVICEYYTYSNISFYTEDQNSGHSLSITANTTARAITHSH